MAPKKAKKRAPVRAKRARRPSKRAARTPLYLSDEMRRSTSYEEVLLNRILSKGRPNETPECAMLFSSVLSSLTPAMRNLYYKSGISAGRLLYRIYQREKRYTWYEESVADLVGFFEKAGFSRVSYSVLPERISIKFHNCGRSEIGLNVHTFEAGIISGFLTAGKGQHVPVEEISCSGNGSEYCYFTSAPAPMQFKARDVDLLSGLTEKVKAEAESHGDRSQRFAEEYYLLGSSSFTRDDYSREMNSVICHMGSMIGSSLGLDAARLKRSGRQLETLFPLLNLCDMRVKSTNPFACEMQFSALKAKKEFVDISISFLNGLLKEYAAERKIMRSSIARRDGTYVVRISEMNGKGKNKR
jgi:predicted hydrocarbon binding protein